MQPELILVDRISFVNPTKPECLQCGYHVRDQFTNHLRSLYNLIFDKLPIISRLGSFKYGRRFKSISQSRRRANTILKTSAFSISLSAIASNSPPTAATDSNSPFHRHISSARKLAKLRQLLLLHQLSDRAS
jgi:hypothetical protein